MTLKGLVAAFVLLAGILPQTASAAPRGCSMPEPKVDYTTERFVIKLKLDLARCGWWHGKTIEMSGSFNRVIAGSPVLGERGGVGVVCSTIRAASGRGGSSGSREVRTTSCSLKMPIEHDPVDVSTYSGSLTFPWKHGDRTIDYSYTCRSLVASASCD